MPPPPLTRAPGSREFRERFEKALGKEALWEVFPFPPLLERLLRWGAADRGGLASALVECLRRLLQPSSHPLLRREGLQLLLLWMKLVGRRPRRLPDAVRRR